MPMQAACKGSLIDLCLPRAAGRPPAESLAVSSLRHLRLMALPVHLPSVHLPLHPQKSTQR